MEPWAAIKKSFKLVWGCYQLLSGLLSNGQLPRMSRQSLLSADVTRDNEMIPGAVYRFPGVYLISEENPGKSQIGDRLMNAILQSWP